MNVTETLKPAHVTVTESEPVSNSLKLEIRNTGDSPAVFDPEAPGGGAFTLSFPLSVDPAEKDTFRYFTSLEQARKITAAPQDGWTATTTRDTAGGIAWRFSPKDRWTLEPGKKLEAGLSNIVSAAPAYPADRLSFLTIRYETGDGTGETHVVPVPMVPPGLSVRSFAAGTGAPVGIGDDVPVSWVVDGADECLLQPGDRTTADRAGAITIRPDADTVCALYATRDNRTVSEFRDVKVADGRALSLTADRTECLTGETIRLTAKVAGAGHAWLNAGIGRFTIEASANGTEKTFDVIPSKRRNTYILSAETARGTESVSCEVFVKNRPGLEFFASRPAAAGKRLISWEVVNARSCVLRDAAGNTLSTRTRDGRVEAPAGPVTMECEGREGQRFIKVFS